MVGKTWGVRSDGQALRSSSSPVPIGPVAWSKSLPPLEPQFPSLSSARLGRCQWTLHPQRGLGETVGIESEAGAAGKKNR